ncbi:glycosyltransferase family 2 protein [Soonwooa sp.]|uniref:glycosyltransferase family 2 protein n=1 Tax=Soonwooa sp. TaxID=1938592 RepID=UPI0028AA9DDC|nr:glycosyltransferase family 2 protein [Soonwooa sp.]
MEHPKVSVVTITYGHEKYITDTLDGVLMQQYDGPVEFIIANDNSPDNTDQVVKKYFAAHPVPDNFEIKYTRHETNKGMMPNFNWALEQATGRYIALCEGDDYWIDPMKLQKQVDVLDTNLEINICSHPSYRRYEDAVKEDQYGYWGCFEKIISAAEVIKNYASTAPFQSIMFRNQYTDEVQLIIEKLLGGHSTLQIYYSIPNGLYYIPQYMSVYRVASSSSISKVLFKKDSRFLERQLQNWTGLDILNKSSNYIFDNEFKESKKLRAYNLISSGQLNNYEAYYLIKNFKLYCNIKMLTYSMKKHAISKLYRFLKSKEK